jgi:carbamoyl-phosphate synthase small subunit
VLRAAGAQNGALLAGTRRRQVAEAARPPRPQGQDLAGSSDRHEWTGQWNSAVASATQSPASVVAYDFGVKRNILRMLAGRGCRVTVVPARTSAQDVLALNPDGIFLSNGPGDPEPCDYAIAAARTLVEAGLPTFGICLGHQILALASGARTFKMKFGHHGANHPVKNLDTGRVEITSQNHGFAVDARSLPANLRPTHVSLFDGTLQGLARTDRPAFCFQGHPEASPGPHDIAYLFDRFVTMMTKDGHA